jgi:hypothetical protein
MSLKLILNNNVLFILLLLKVTFSVLSREYISNLSRTQLICVHGDVIRARACYFLVVATSRSKLRVDPA